MTRPETILGRWRITGMSTWDKPYIDRVEPGLVTFAARTMGEMAFGVVTAALDCSFDNSKVDVSSNFTGSDESDEVSGNELDRAIKTVHDHRRHRLQQWRRYHLKARRW